MIKTELDQFKDSLNLPDIEKRLEGITSLERELTTKIENSQNTCDVKTRTLHTLVNEIDEVNDELKKRTTALENKPRFAAEIRPSSYDYLPKGDIAGFTQLVDVGNIFDPQTGRLTIKDEGMYSLMISGLKSGTYGKKGIIYVYKNQDLIRKNFEDD